MTRGYVVITISFHFIDLEQTKSQHNQRDIHFHTLSVHRLNKLKSTTFNNMAMDLDLWRNVFFYKNKIFIRRVKLFYLQSTNVWNFVVLHTHLATFLSHVLFYVNILNIINIAYRITDITHSVLYEFYVFYSGGCVWGSINIVHFT